MRHFTTKDGLPGLTIYDIYQDEMDYIWLGTDKGLCSYNGQQFIYYHNITQKGTSINGIQEDSQGRIWCKNFGHQLFYIEQDSMYILDKGPFVKEKVLEFDIDQQDILWVTAADKLLRYDIHKQEWSVVPFANAQQGINHLAIDGNGLWISHPHSGFLHAPLGQSSFQEIPCTQCPDSVVLRPIGGQQNTFFISPKHGQQKKQEIFLYEQDSIRPLKLANSLLGSDLIGAFQDQHQQIWIYTYTGCFMLKNPGIEKVNVKYFLRNAAVTKVIQDREGNYWFSTLNQGLYLLPNLQVNYYIEDNSTIKDNRIVHLAKIDNDRLLLGNSGIEHHLLNIPQNQLSHTLQTSSPRPNEAMFYDSLSQRLYIQQDGLHVFDKKQDFKLVDFKQLPNIKDFHLLEDQYLLVATRNSAMFLRKDLQPFGPDDMEAFASIPYCQQQIEQRPVGLKIQRKQRCNTIYAKSMQELWLGFSDTVMFYNGQKFTPILSEEGKTLRPSDIVGTQDGMIWIATIGQGLFGVKNQKVVHHYTERDGLKSLNLLTLEADESVLWVGTDMGLHRINMKSHEIEIFDISDGLASNEIKDIEIIKQQIWLATSEGLTVFNKTMPSTNKYAPRIYIEQVAISGIDTSIHKAYTLPHFRNDLSIRFQGIAYRSQGRMRYKYRMIGLSDEWIYANFAQNELRFMGLNPGQYRLEVLAENEDGVESEQAVTIDFYILRPYWQKWWFWTIIILALGSTIGLIISWRIRNYQKQQQLKIQINQLRVHALQAQMNPHFVFNAMNAIQKLVVQRDIEEALTFMGKFAKLIRYIFELSGQQQVELEEEISFLKLYLDLEKLRFKNKVDIVFDIDPILLGDIYAVPPLMIQPIIENSFKHGLMHKQGLGTLHIHFKKEHDFLHVIVEDNGVGRKRAAELSDWKSKQRRKSGLSVTQDRLRVLKQHPIHKNNLLITDLESEDGQAIGTRTELWIPFLGIDIKNN